MKKLLCIYIGLIIFAASFFSQEVEVVKHIKFGDPLNFWTEWDPNEGYAPGIRNILVSKNNEILLQANGENNIFYANDFTKELTTLKKEQEGLDRFILMNNIKDGYIAGYADVVYINQKPSSYIYNLYFNKNDVLKEIKAEFKKGETGGTFYYTGNTIFMQTEKKDLVSIELLSDGTNKVRGVDETKSWLESGKGEEIGLSYNEVEATHTFGDNSFSKPGPSYWNIMNDLTLKKPELAEKHRMRGTGYGYLGEDSKGLIYFRNMVSDKGKWNYDNQGLNIQFGIAVIDVWTKQVYFYEDYAKNEWNPPRNSEGKFIGSYAWTVAPDGSIYFADADTDKGEYQIKRIPNRWYKDMGMESRTIGQMNANHIPLAKEASATAQNDGYCFENDFVWVKETKASWSRIQKIDGRTGWVESRYIDIE